MWIVRHGQMMFNIDFYQKIIVNENGIVLQENDEEYVILKFETKDDATKAFNYIIEGMKNKSSVIFL